MSGETGRVEDRTLAGRLRRLGRSWPWALSFSFMAVALLWRVVLASVAPGIGYFSILLPPIVLAGIFCRTLPAVCSAVVGVVVVVSCLLWRDPHVLPSRAALVDAAFFVPGVATVLWATAAPERARKQAAEVEARLAEVFRQIPGAAAILGAPEGRVLLRSKMSFEILGHPARAIRSADDLAAYYGIHPDGRPFAADEYPIVRALRTGEVVRGEVIRYRRPDAIVELEIHAGPVRGPDGRIVAAVGMAFDVTERIHVEQQLREREAAFRAQSDRLDAALDVGGLGLWEIDLATRATVWDARFAAMLGLPPVPIELSMEAGRRFFAIEDEARALDEFERAVASGQTYTSEIRARTLDGQTRWLLMRGIMSKETGRGFGVVRDVTDQRLREDALRAAVEARELLLQEADHRIKNSLQLVVSMLRLARTRLRDPEGVEALTDAIARVNAVADAHLALQHSGDLRTIDVAAMIGDLCPRLATLNPDVTLHCTVEGPINLAAAKAIPLGLMLNEVITNALRHAYVPGVSGRITVLAKVVDRTLEVAIADDGLGLPTEGARRGLGTRVVAALVAQIGAVETRRSAPGYGTSITFRLLLNETATG